MESNDGLSGWSTDSEGSVDSDSPRVDEDTLHPNLAHQQRIRIALSGALFPLVCLISGWAGANATVNEPWQNGDTEVYVGLLLKWPAIVPLSILPLFSLVCLALWTFRPEMARYFVVRFGIYSGVLVASWFLVLIMLTSWFITFIAAAVAWPLLFIAVLVLQPIAKHARKFTIRHLLILTAICAVLAAIVRLLNYAPLGYLMTGYLLILMATPTLNLIAYVRASIRISSVEWPLQGVPITIGLFISWILVAIATWRIAILIMLDEYSKLPTTNPNCYVSAAAQRGHAGLVNRLQTKRLKFLEFAFAGCCPRLHRAIRWVYDRIGPPLARLCGTNRWFADATYLALMPVEWIAECVRVMTRVPKAKVAAIYSASSRCAF